MTVKGHRFQNTDKTLKILFAALLAATGVLFLYAIFFGDVQGEAYTGSFEVVELSRAWTMEAPDGTITPGVTLPLDVYQHAGERVVLRHALPADIRDGMRLCIRAQRQDVVIRVNGEVRSTYRVQDFVFRRLSLTSAYLLADLRDGDALGELEIEIVSRLNEAGRYHSVTYGFGNNVWFPLIEANLPLVLTASVLIIAGILSIFVYYCLREKLPNTKTVVYLAESLIVAGMWMLSESDIRQIIFHSPSFSNVFSFLLVETMAAFFMMYVNEMQEHRYETAYTFIECVILIQVIVNSILNVTQIADYYRTLNLSHIWSGCAILCVVVTLALDIIRGKIREYSYTATGLLLLLFACVFELANFYLPGPFGFGVFLGVGLLLMLGMTVLQTVSNELRRAEYIRMVDSASHAKTNFLANMSHEIRTPINAILGMDEMILRESSEEQIRSYAGDIRAAGKTLMSLINDILDFSKVEEGRMQIIPTQYDLSSVINDLVSMTRGRAENKGLRFDVQVDETTPHLLIGDELRIRQCALNILTNAVKYTEKGGVTLSVGYEKADEDAISLRISVSDTGIGMKKEDMARLFSPFARIEEMRNRNIEGTGLGMSITKQLLTLMGGELEVESVYGEGSTFSFALRQPVVKWVPVGKFTGHYKVNAPRRAYHERLRAPDARVLAVDDTPLNLAVVKGLLKKTDIQIDTAASGPEAIERAAKTHYDIIFVDHMMPGMDGIETLRELKKLPDADQIVYIALTANALSGSRERYLDAGFTDYLSKPVDGEKLEEMLASYLPEDKLLAPGDEDPGGPVPSDRACILLADDDPRSCRLAMEILGNGYLVKVCTNGGEVARSAERLQPDLILLDLDLGGMSGFEVLHALREQPETSEIPVVFLADADDEESEIAGFRSGAADYIRKPFVPEALLQRTRRIVALHRLQRGLQSEVGRQTQRAERLTREMMLALSQTVDAKDHYTNGHSKRVAAYAAELARRLGKSRQEQEKLYETGLMHDIGKIGVPEEIINKQPLSDEEFEKIKRHAVLGSEILSHITEMPELAAGARSHHERWDGTGYPDGLRGEQIPEAARIICVADSYDAMTSTRIYSTRWTQEAVRAEIERCSGTQFDPRVARAMLEMIDEDKDFLMTEQSADIHVWKGSGKLWEATEAEIAPAAPEEEAPALPPWLAEIGELDQKSGLRHCGTEETWLDALRIYAQSAPGGADEIETLWAAGDVANTIVKVHALKSTSRAIGAETLGALAEKLELAGKAGDTQTLGAGLDGLLADYRALGERLAPLCETVDESELPPLTEQEVREAYDAIREVLTSMDYESITFLSDYLGRHRVPEGERERCEAIRRAADDFDWEKIDELLNEVQGEASLWRERSCSSTTAPRF